MLLAPLLWLMVAQAQASTTPLTGVVVGPDGAPAAGARLVLMGMPSYDPPTLATGESDAGGRFALERPAGLAGDHHPQRAPILFAFKPGFSISATHFPEAMPRADEPLRVVLAAPGKARVRVEGPDGLPLAGAEVLPERLRTHFANIPDALAELAAATTGPDGVAVLDAVTQQELAYVDVHSAEFGVQGRDVGPTPGGPVVVALRPVGAWKGRLTAGDPAHVRGWRVRAWTRFPMTPFGREEPRTTGYIKEAVADAEGRFALSPIAVGPLQLSLTPPGDLPVVVDMPDGLAVREGSDEEVEIPLRRPVLVTGRIVERGTGKPVAGVQASLSAIGPGANRSETAKTDADGRYTLRSLPGKVRVSWMWPPPSHVLAPGQHWEDFDVAEGSGPVELKPREALAAAPPLRGLVRDEAGRPVPGANVQASWALTEVDGSGSGAVATTSDARGGFVLEGLGPDSAVTINVRLRDRKNPEPFLARGGDPGPVTVAIVPTPVFAVAGRLVGPGGTPLAGVVVQLQVRTPRDDYPGFPEPVQFADGATITTGPDGTFLSPRELERKVCEVRAEAVGPQFADVKTPWVAAPDGERLTLPDLTVRPARGVRVVSGRVVDRDGKGVAGARVSQAGDGPERTSAPVDAEGRFRLNGVAGGEALVFAEAPGFRFGGTVVGAGGGPWEIRLAREGEPPVAAPKPPAPPLSRAEERAMARELLAHVPTSSGTSPYGGGASMLGVLARVDPGRVLDLIEARAVPSAADVSHQAALGQLEDDPAAAIATIEADLEPGSRAFGWLALEGYRPPLERARREDFLRRALADARRAGSDDAKVQLLGRIADRWLDLGAIEEARPILVEGRAIVDAAPADRWSSQAEDFGEVLAAIDLPAAMALFERRGKMNVSPADEASIVRHKAQAALRIAARDPAEAERLIAAPSPNFSDRPAVVLQVARKVAKADPDRARRLVESLREPGRPGDSPSPFLVPFGLGAIADGLAEADPARARGLLDEAFVGLRAIADGGLDRQSPLNAAIVMARLLPVVARADPDRLAERTWLAAASRSPTGRQFYPAQENLATLELARLLAPYDRAMALAVFAPAYERLVDMFVDPIGLQGNTLPEIAGDLAVVDPRAIPPLLASLPDPARRPEVERPFGSVEQQLRLAAAKILGLPPGARARELERGGTSYGTYILGD